MDARDNSPEAGDDFSAMLGSILSNPQMMSAISSMADQLKGSQSSPSEENKAGNDGTEREINGDKLSAQGNPDLSGAVSALAPLLSGKGLSHIGADDNRSCLLRALKPYLSKGRCDTIDQIITLSKLSYLFKSSEGR